MEFQLRSEELHLSGHKGVNSEARMAKDIPVLLSHPECMEGLEEIHAVHFVPEASMHLRCIRLSISWRISNTVAQLLNNSDWSVTTVT